MAILKTSDSNIHFSADLIYPVGSIYFSANSTNPASIFGGTWTQLTGKFLYMSTSSLTTGGASSHAHSTNATTLTVNQMPSHSHTYLMLGQPQTSGNPNPPLGGYLPRTSASTDATGGGQSHTHNNTGNATHLPPYMTIYAWRRTA